jgi:uncharacterized membrane protein
MKSVLRKNWDITIMIVVFLFMILLLIWRNSIISYLCLLLILFIPGHMIVCIIFPKKERLDKIERPVLSFAISMVFISLLWIIYNFIQPNFKLDDITELALVSSIILAGVAFIVRNKIDHPYLPINPIPTINHFILGIYKEKSSGKIPIIILITLIILTISSLSYVLTLPYNGETFTEFSIIGAEEGNIYSKNLTMNENSSIILGLSNHEHSMINYSIEIWLVNMNYNKTPTNIVQLYYLDKIDVRLNNTEESPQSNNIVQYETIYNFTIKLTGQYKLWFILYKNTVPTLPYEPHRYENFANTTATQRINDCIDNKYQSLNINMNIVP